MDHLTKEKRSWNMSLIRSRNTRPEVFVRSVVHRLGLRFGLHKSDLAGKPDIVLRRHKAVIFIHGCFWHQHRNCKRSNIPKSNKKYWTPKLERNIERDKINKRNLRKEGWRVIILWECQARDPEELKLELIKQFSQ